MRYMRNENRYDPRQNLDKLSLELQVVVNSHPEVRLGGRL
jgi:hypothetical protein